MERVQKRHKNWGGPTRRAPPFLPLCAGSQPALCDHRRNASTIAYVDESALWCALKNSGHRRACGRSGLPQRARANSFHPTRIIPIRLSLRLRLGSVRQWPAVRRTRLPSVPPRPNINTADSRPAAADIHPAAAVDSRPVAAAHLAGAAADSRLAAAADSHAAAAAAAGSRPCHLRPYGR